MPTDTTRAPNGGHASLCPPYALLLNNIRLSLWVTFMGHRVRRDDVERCCRLSRDRVLAARHARVFQISYPLCIKRAQGMPGVRCTRSRVCKKKRTRVSNHRYTANSRHSLRDGFTAYTWSPRGPGFLAPVVCVMRSIIANLTPASGRQDHTISPST